MAALLGLLIIASVLTVESLALSCTQCISIFTSQCTGESITCPPDQMCGSTYTETIAQGIRSTIFIRSCTPTTNCNFNGSISLNGRQTRMDISCCNSDGCVTRAPSLPTNTDKLNGVVCGSCFSADSTWCYTSDTIQCKGNENMCLLLGTEMGQVSTAVRGCSTKSICDHGSQSYTFGGSSLKTKVTCKNGGLSAYNVALTPAIVCLLLLKLFF